MKDGSRLTTLVALVLLVAAVVSLGNGLPDLDFVSDTFLWILGGLLIWRLAGGACCGVKRNCRAPSESTGA